MALVPFGGGATILFKKSKKHLYTDLIASVIRFFP
jgi:hypothetical protein